MDLFASRETSHCPLWFSLTHPAPLGLDAMVQTWPRFRLHAFSQSLCSRESWREFARTGFYYFSLPRRAGQSMVTRYNIPSRRASSGAPRREGPSVPSKGLEISPPTRTVETVGLASQGAQLIDSGPSTEVFETILHSRAPSMRKLYALKWRVFTSWCSDHQLDPVNCPVGTDPARAVHYRASPVHSKGLCGGHKYLTHSFGCNVIEKDPWYLVSSVVL